MKIKRNLIKNRIYLYCEGDLDKVDEMMKSLERQYFHNQPKKWTRILNNNSMPTLTVAAGISGALSLKIDDLFEFDFENGN